MHHWDKEFPREAETSQGSAVMPADDGSRSTLLRAQQIRAQYDNLPGAFIGSALIASVVAEILHDRRPTAVVLVWLAVAYLHSGLRCALWFAFRRARPVDADCQRWGVWLVAGALVSGLIWGAGGIVLYSPDSLSYELFVLLVTTGLVFTSTYISAPYMPAFVAFAGPTFLLSSVPFLLAGGALHLGIGAAVLLIFLPLVTRYAAVQCRSFVQSLDVRLRNAELVAELRAQKLAAEEANVAKSRFLAVASHDLRQPLHALGLFVEALQRARLPTHEHQLVGNVRRTVDAMAELFDELLDISRLDAGVIRARVETFELSSVLDRMRIQYAPLAQRKGLSLSVLDTSVYVRSDPVLLTRIIGNLLANAVRYTDRGGVVLGCRRDGPSARVEVWDTGCGIPPEKHEEVFKEFTQLADAGRKGLGLGLAIVARLAQLLEHRIRLRSVVGRGSVFAVTLPRGRAEDCSARGDVNPSAAFDLSAVLALVLETHPDSADSVTACLRKWDCRVITAASEAQLLIGAVASSSAPDLIVVELGAGGATDPSALVRHLRSEFNAEIPALLIASAAGPAPDEAQAEFPSLPGPANPARLRTLIVNLLRPAPPRPQSAAG
ncbi:MAG TPA: HAMP domain-containing sensor histidine kinase [Steroidobacteraceae bacterium]|jgi:signal transduction histidine kinase/CheY-like chemotaxis protein